jgi:hypothetical protein
VVMVSLSLHEPTSCCGDDSRMQTGMNWYSCGLVHIAEEFDKDSGVQGRAVRTVAGHKRFDGGFRLSDIVCIVGCCFRWPSCMRSIRACPTALCLAGHRSGIANDVSL